MVPERPQLAGLDGRLGRDIADDVGIDEARLPSGEIGQEAAQAGIVDGHRGEEGLEPGAVAVGHRPDRIEGGEDQRLLLGGQLHVQHRDRWLASADGLFHPGVAIDDVAGRRVDQDLLDPADGIERAAQGVPLAAGWVRQLAGLARSWVGSSVPAPVIRLRQPVAGILVIGHPGPSCSGGRPPAGW